MTTARARVMQTCLLSALLMLSGAAPLEAGERYFITVFGSQTYPKLPRYTHTWLAFVRWTDAAPGCNHSCEIKVVSWMPERLDIRPFAFQPEEGINLDMNYSLLDAIGKHERIAMWGPYEMDPAIGAEFYGRVCRHVQLLESGEMRYRCLVTDSGVNSRPVTNCIHAATMLVPESNRTCLARLRRFGHEASEFFIHLLALNRWIDPSETHDWVIPLLGIENYPVHQRPYRRHYKWGPE